MCSRPSWLRHLTWYDVNNVELGRVMVWFYAAFYAVLCCQISVKYLSNMLPAKKKKKAEKSALRLNVAHKHSIALAAVAQTFICHFQLEYGQAKGIKHSLSGLIKAVPYAIG